MRRYISALILSGALLAGAGATLAQDLDSLKKDVSYLAEQSQVKAILDQSYADNSNPKQMVDVFLPKSPVDEKPLPVVVLIHGGGWIGGDRLTYAGLAILLAQTKAYAAVTVGYRLTNEAHWPAQVHDVKAAVRWIRGHAKELNLDTDRIAVMGASAGGHLASLLGTSGDVKELEGGLGKFTHLSSRVACVVNQCGPEDFSEPLMITANGEPVIQDDAVIGLLGGSYVDKKAEAKAASPVTYVSSDDPPFLTIHGTTDERVTFKHAEIIHTALKKAGVTSYLIPITNGGHGSIYHSETDRRALTFIEKYLLGKEAVIDETPVEALPLRK